MVDFVLRIFCHCQSLQLNVAAHRTAGVCAFLHAWPAIRSDVPTLPYPTLPYPTLPYPTWFRPGRAGASERSVITDLGQYEYSYEY